MGGQRHLGSIQAGRRDADIVARMPLSTEELRARLAARPWTAHNVVLNAEVSTLPGAIDFVEENGIVRAVRRTVESFLGADLRGVRIADLGCLEGGFSLAFARRGAEVLGIEARPENVEKCRLLEEHFALPNLRFDRADVKEFSRERFGAFDVVLALGILYHLDDPVGWLARLGEATEALLVVETHWAPDADDAVERLRPEIRRLGPAETFVRGGSEYRGRWFREYESDAERDAMPWASYSNPRSFWLTRPSILRAVAAAGFDLVYEQYDHWIHRYEAAVAENPRGTFVGGKSAALRERGRPAAPARER